MNAADTVDMQARANEAQRQAQMTWMQAERERPEEQRVEQHLEAGAGAEYARYEAQRREMGETNESALRRSLDAESILQAEVALLRERTSQLQMRLDEQRRVFVTGVKQMMQPLEDYFKTQHLEVPFEALVPQTIEQLGVLTHTVRHLREAAQTGRRAAGARSPVADLPQLAHVETLLAQVVSRLETLEDARRDVSPSPAPETYDTFVMSDRQSAEIERALLDSQTRGRSFSR